MSIIQHLTEKPWQSGQSAVDNQHSGATFALPQAKLGVRMLLAVGSVVFFLLVVAYGDRMLYEDWRPAPQQWLLWLNTAMLIVASAGMQGARIASRRDNMDGVVIGLTAGGVFAIAFIGGQILAWRQLDVMHEAATANPAASMTNPAIAFFYLISGLHALHLLGGLVAWGRTAEKVWRGLEMPRVRLSVELCTIYWHFLLLVWLVLFALLFSGDENLQFLLELCGLR